MENPLVQRLSLTFDSSPQIPSGGDGGVGMMLKSRQIIRENIPRCNMDFTISELSASCWTMIASWLATRWILRPEQHNSWVQDRWMAGQSLVAPFNRSKIEAIHCCQPHLDNMKRKKMTLLWKSSQLTLCLPFSSNEWLQPDWLRSHTPRP